MSDTKFDFRKFLNESRETLLNPRGYFPSMSLSGGMTEPLIKAVIYGAVAGFFIMIWPILGLASVGGSAFMGFGGLMALIGSVISGVIGLFIAGAIMLLISTICGGNADFEANLRVAAAIMVIYPINAFLTLFDGINYTLGGVISLLVTFYTLYLVYQAQIDALKGKESTARIVLIVLVVLSLLGFWGGRRVTQNFLDTYSMPETEMSAPALIE